MEWQIQETSNPREFILQNRSRTLVCLSKKTNLKIKNIFQTLELFGVPFGYTSGLDEIYFTVLRSSIHGDYWKNKIRISCGSFDQGMIEKTLIHEIAHHLDDLEGLSDFEEIIDEKRTSARYLDSCARKDASEYIAVGFEIFYCGSLEQRKKLQKKNPLLVELIKDVHLKYGGRYIW